MPDWRFVAVLMGVLLMAAVPLAAADKTDIAQLSNGDRLTCEIKKLDRSILVVSTDPLGKASIHWGEVRGLTSPRTFEIQRSSGEHYVGSLVAAPPGQLAIALAGAAPIVLPMSDVIRVAPIGASLWNRIDGTLDAGFSFAQANSETHYTLNGTGTYRSPRYLLTTSIASQFTTRSDTEPTTRNSLGVNGNRSFGNQWYTIAWGQVQENNELSLDLRLVAGGGVGKDFAHTTRRLWSGYIGLAYTDEQFTDVPRERSLEAALGGNLDFFTPGNEDFKITNRVISYFNVTGRGRVRLELQSSWRHEFLGDFYWAVNGFDSFDSDPPNQDKKNDFGASITLGWKF
jgi:hypothetical protein